MKVALFRDTQFENAQVVFDHIPFSPCYVQITGWAEVEFPPLSEAEQRVANDLVALAKRKETFEEDFRRQRKVIEDERAALLKTGT